MKIETLVLGELQTNCYLVYDENSKEGVIIDPADSAEFIAEKIQNLKLKPKAIIASHGHFDHILAAGELQLILNKFKIQSTKFQINSKLLPFFIHKNDLFLVRQMNQSAGFWLEDKINKPKPKPINIKFIKENDQINFGKFSLTVIETPGHTPGSISLLLNSLTDKSGIQLTLFSGDTLFKNAIGRYDFSYSSKKKLISSLKKIFQLQKNTLIYPGHGEKTILSQEKFPFLSP